jgi:hypothetical protein
VNTINCFLDKLPEQFDKDLNIHKINSRVLIFLVKRSEFKSIEISKWKTFTDNIPKVNNSKCLCLLTSVCMYTVLLKCMEKNDKFGNPRLIIKFDKEVNLILLL